jgi:hypothetical protein
MNGRVGELQGRSEQNDPWIPVVLLVLTDAVVSNG